MYGTMLNTFQTHPSFIEDHIIRTFVLASHRRLESTTNPTPPPLAQLRCT
jgi:hypothetical protein